MTDLSDRFLDFSKEIVVFCRSLQLDTVSRPVVSQLVRSATSVGANYHEAQSGISRKEFRAKIFICLKEADETRYWLKLLHSCYPDKKLSIDALSEESKQISKILQTIVNKLNQ